ncbi:tetratricopeptide repeat protein [Colwellia echini]|uniref:Tetratricopeptide repeat protein n=1 Tax=Colwellia echini TaxID=1982103 RepID=A0ABY3N0X9_9GAMM|nr:tetratricopeptide repeat protein [Colwellia echini]TYK67142.1 tetratricopeptide repeat protein [Colwellia echini]
MSVINQMLKDLEQRDPEKNKQNAQRNNTVSGVSAPKVALFSGFSVLFLCLISFFIWQLITENNALKAEKSLYQNNRMVTSSAHEKTTVQLSEQGVTQPNTGLSLRALNNNKITSTSATLSGENELVETDLVETDLVENKPNEQNNSTDILPTKVTPAISSSSSSSSSNSSALKNTKQAPVTVANNSSKVTPAKKANMHSHDGDEISHSHDIVTSPSKTKSPASSNQMSVSRRHLSADELVAKKLVLAEKALEANQVEKAEKLLEDVVILKPSDSQTRKKLAALWFGRQAYQNATNLLSQGIALNSKDSSLREMKARIHLQQNQVTAALNTLKPLAQLKNEQYQLMLANIAQQAQQNDIAITAYKTLISMQPEKGRWHLAIAVLYDKNSQFILANESYNKALANNDLSFSSEDFVKQRIIAIAQ